MSRLNEEFETNIWPDFLEKCESGEFLKNDVFDLFKIQDYYQEKYSNWNRIIEGIYITLEKNNINMFENQTQIPTMFCYCWNFLKKITIPATVRIIGAHAFSGCKYLETVLFEKDSYDLFRILDGAFSDCWSLKDIKLPEGIEVLEEFTFNGCLNLKEFYVPDSLKDFLPDSCWVFNKCISLRNIVFSTGDKLEVKWDVEFKLVR